jgi:hypothetical protein
MTVVLVGVGADEEHLRPGPSVDSDGRYEYIPIPETWSTTEDRTYGNLQLEHQDAVASDIIDRIRPKGEGDDWITDEDEIATHSIHYDPDFSAQTFGDRRGGGGTGSTLVRELSSDDILGFYTGLRGPEGHLNRYIYGYFTVESVNDLAQFSGEEYRARLQSFSENAHAKRLEAEGKPKHNDVVVVNGKDPGEQLTQPYQISKWLGRAPWYQLTSKFVEEFNVENGEVVVSRKPALTLNISNEDFISKVT